MKTMVSRFEASCIIVLAAALLLIVYVSTFVQRNFRAFEEEVFRQLKMEVESADELLSSRWRCVNSNQVVQLNEIVRFARSQIDEIDGVVYLVPDVGEERQVAGIVFVKCGESGKFDVTIISVRLGHAYGIRITGESSFGSPDWEVNESFIGF